MNWQDTVERTVTGLGYELVECERSAGGLLRAYIDRLPGRVYAGGDGDFVTVDDCELVTRQLQYVLEVEGVDYDRLEVSSPGLDRPLRREADYQRFLGSLVEVMLKQIHAGRKRYQGLLRLPAARAGVPARSGYELVFKDGKEDKVLGFALDEVREAKLVPVIDFKGRRTPVVRPASAPEGGADAVAPTGEQGAGGADPSGVHQE
jgi:ribosome maturation factor RimP